MSRHVMARVVGCLAVATGLTTINPGRVLAAGFIHVIVITDDQDRKVGESVRISGDQFAESFSMNVPLSRFSIRRLGGPSLSPNSILAAIQALPVTAGQDTVVVYSATHGGFDPNQGSYLFFPRTRQSLTRSNLKSAIESKGARLGVLITESCNNVKVIPSPPVAPGKGAPLPLTDVSPLFRALFLSHAGFVDLASSKPGERSLCYPKLKSGQVIFADRGAIFTSALVMMMMIHHDDALTWTQMVAEVAPAVRSEFKQVAPDGLEDEDEPDKIQRTQTVDLRSPGTWSPTEEATAHASTRLRFGALGQGVPGVGVKLVQVYSGSTAQKMGLEVGDIIRSINGVGVDDIVNYVRLVKNSGPRITLEVRDVRTGNYVQAQGDLDDGQGDDGPPPAPSRPRFGAVAVNHNGPSGGLFVTHLVPGTPAARLQLDYGDIILEINGRPITDQVSYAAAVRESGRTMDLLIINVRNGQRQTAQVMLDY